MLRGFRVCYVIISLGCAFSAQAQELSGLYFGASIGEATNEVDEFKGNDTAFKLTGGYAFNEYLGIELAYVYAGTQTDTVELRRIENESAGMIASALLNLPLGEQFAVFGKLGYAFYDSDATVRLGDLVMRENDSGEDWAYGIGLALAVTGRLKFRAEYEGVDVTGGDFDISSAGFTYEF